jgi:hypothetical protein
MSLLFSKGGGCHAATHFDGQTGQGGDATFDILDRQTLRAGNQKKFIAPRRLALIVGSSNYLKPDVPLPEIPTAFLYLGCWFPVAGVVYYFFGMETKGKSIAQIDRELAPA